MVYDTKQIKEMIDEIVNSLLEDWKFEPTIDGITNAKTSIKKPKGASLPDYEPSEDEGTKKSEKMRKKYHDRNRGKSQVTHTIDANRHPYKY